MRVTGFTFIRNAIKFDYPVVEAIRSILPVCDDFVVSVGKSEDETLEIIQNIDRSKIRAIETVWDDSPELKSGGRIYARETDKAFQAIPEDTDWAFYIQGDEVIHEKYLDTVKSAMEKWKDDKNVDGLLFNYLHFYGSYDYVGTSPRWYDNEIRIVRNDKSIYSYKDAQGFRKNNNRKLNVKPVDAFVYHYGWVKDPKKMQEKLKTIQAFYPEVEWIKRLAESKDFDYSAIDSLRVFEDSHPGVMEERIRNRNWKFDYDLSMNKMSVRYRAKIFLKEYLGINTFYENYIIV